MKNMVCGFVVLRKPEKNYDSLGRGIFNSTAPKVLDCYYSGIDRMPWFELDEDYFLGNLPDNYKQIRLKIREDLKDFSGLSLLKDIDLAKKVLEYSNKDLILNELGVFYSSNLKAMKGAIDTSYDVEWLGTDIFVNGYGSHLINGIYTNPEIFDNFLNDLNENGLFDLNSPQIDSYINKYTEFEKEHNLEPVKDILHLLDKINVGRVSIKLTVLSAPQK